MTERNDLYIYVILDGSGSMSNVQDDVVGGVNALIKEQKALDDNDTFFSLTTFDNNVKRWYDESPMQDVDDVDRSVTFLGGGTALLDAVGKTLTDARNQNHEGRKLVVIYTDGYENASREWNNDGVKKLIRDLENEGGWAFTFMSADLDNFEQAAAIGIHKGNYAVANSGTTYGNLVGTARAAHSHRLADVAVAAAGTTAFMETYNLDTQIAEAEKDKDSTEE